MRILSLVPVVCFLATASAADKHALLVGVTKYSHSRMNDTPLQYPEADAKAVADELQKSGYSVVTLLGKQATAETIQKELDKLASQGSEGGVCLVGLIGHGVQYGSDAYFGPYDTGIRYVTDSAGNRLRDNDGKAKLEPDPKTMTSMRSILDSLSACGATNRVLLADCCREDPSAARGRAFGSKLSIADLPPGMAALFACSASEKAFEHKDWGHGAFTHALLERLQNTSGSLTANELSVSLYRDVLTAVRAKTNGSERQTVNPIINGIIELKLSPSVITSSTGMELKLIPTGSFMMGSGRSAKEVAEKYENFGAKESYFTDEHPRHRVTLTKPFYMGVHEVTRGQFGAFVRDQNYETESERDGEGGYGWNEAEEKFEGRDPKYSWKNVGFTQPDDHPVVNVTWNDAVAFCTWLSRKEGRTYRLPTEAEWEYACRAGTTTEFSNGDDPEQLVRVGNVADATAKAKHSFMSWVLSAADGHVYTAPAGGFRPNAFGLYDMHGNVYEWCSDLHGDYSSSSQRDPVGASSGSSRVLRGGSWYYLPINVRSAYRNHFAPGRRSFYLGFRVVSESE